jgi:hypothetical protein
LAAPRPGLSTRRNPIFPICFLWGSSCKLFIYRERQFFNYLLKGFCCGIQGSVGVCFHVRPHGHQIADGTGRQWILPQPLNQTTSGIQHKKENCRGLSSDLHAWLIRSFMDGKPYAQVAWYILTYSSRNNRPNWCVLDFALMCRKIATILRHVETLAPPYCFLA